MKGDVITTVAQKRFKDGDDLLDAAARAAKTPTYPLDVMRDGKSVRLQMARAFRPTATEVVVGIAAAPVPVAIAAMPQTSVADELAKLAKLKADGLLTQAEFDAQKSKLLAK